MINEILIRREWWERQRAIWTYYHLHFFLIMVHCVVCFTLFFARWHGVQKNVRVLFCEPGSGRSIGEEIDLVEPCGDLVLVRLRLLVVLCPVWSYYLKFIVVYSLCCQHPGSKLLSLVGWLVGGGGKGIIEIMKGKERKKEGKKGERKCSKKKRKGGQRGYLYLYFLIIDHSKNLHQRLRDQSIHLQNAPCRSVA